MHWYDSAGLPAYEIEGANGKLRPTTLRDAKKLHLVPSVTTVMSVQDKPALLVWKQNQILDAAVRCPFHPFDDEREWRAKVVREAGEISKAAAENGSKIHDSIEQHIKTGCSNIQIISTPVVEFLNSEFKGFEWVAEDSFSHPMGFGGKIDLYGVKGRGKKTEQRMVLDFKTKNKDDAYMQKIKAYDDHHIQTAAYVKGLEDTKFDKHLDYSLWKRYNLFIGYELRRDILGIEDNIPIVGKEYFVLTGLKLTESKDFAREWGMFEKLLEFWKLKNNYEC